MNPAGSHDAPLAMIDRLATSTNAHDVDALVDCFAADYRNETPAHPARGFTGREQVRRNWQQIFAAVPDLHAVVLRSAVAGDTVWSEWEMSGTRRDGTAHLMRGTPSDLAIHPGRVVRPKRRVSRSCRQLRSAPDDPARARLRPC